MDIQDLGGSKLEQTYVPSEPPQACPGCASGVNPGDRFCQECGTRIGTNRSKRATIKDKSERVATEPGSASIICINCGTTNKALSTVCSDCKIPLIPAQRRREDKLPGEQTGLRGSLTTRSKKTVFRATENAVVFSQGRDSNSLDQNTPVETHSEHASTKVSVATNSSSNSVCPDPESEVATDSEPAHRLAATSTKTVETATNETRDIPTSDGAAPLKKSRVKQRLPGFVSPIFKRQNFSDTSEEGAALDFLFADSSPSGQSGLSPFDKLISETRSMGSYFSISTAQYYVECFFERIPLPLLFLLLSVVLICVTVTATTHWNRYEQRLKAIDKIAINNEEKMRAFRLDEVISTMQELEKTEKGDLPPRARAVLDQSLWLRSYSFAKQHEYAKAISDLSFVTANFISYEDAVEKLAEYKKLLARHPEFASPNQSTVDAKAGVAQSMEKLKPAKPGTRAEVVPSLIEYPKKPKVRSHHPNDQGSAALNHAKPEVRQPAPEAVATPVPKDVPLKADKNKRSTKSEAAHLDRDMKRYSNLLVEYFSTAESNQSDHVAEPPSYEEWTKSGKPDF